MSIWSAIDMPFFMSYGLFKKIIRLSFTGLLNYRDKSRKMSSHGHI